MRNSFENFLRNKFLSEAEYPDMESKRAAALTRKELYPDMESRRVKAIEQSKNQEEQDVTRSPKITGGGLTTQMMVSGIDPGKKLQPIFTFTKPFVKESTDRMKLISEVIKMRIKK
jgi:hypothetical protein